jgi:putative hydrolase of the HAD superfamily
MTCFTKSCRRELRSEVFGNSIRFKGIEDSIPLGVIFDVDGTLYYQNYLRILVVIRLAMFLLIRPFKTTRVIKIIWHYRRAQEWLRKNISTNKLTPDAQLVRTVQKAGISREEVSRCISEWMEKVPLSFLSLCSRRRLIRLILTWNRLGVPMAIYSDYPVEDKLRKLGLQNQIGVVVCSGDADVMSFKPAARGFKVAAEKMGLAPSQIVYIGDREDVDAIGAQNAGMIPIIITKNKKRNKSLKLNLTLAILDSQIKEIYAVKGVSTAREMSHAS